MCVSVCPYVCVFVCEAFGNPSLDVLQTQHQLLLALLAALGAAAHRTLWVCPLHDSFGLALPTLRSFNCLGKPSHKRLRLLIDNLDLVLLLLLLPLVGKCAKIINYFQWNACAWTESNNPFLFLGAIKDTPCKAAAAAAAARGLGQHRFSQQPHCAVPRKQHQKQFQG